MLTKVKRAYIAGFLDADGSVYVRLKPNASYRFGYQIAPYVALFQSQKDRKKFEEICNLIGLGKLRVRKDGILEYTIGRTDAIKEFLYMVEPFVILKRNQVNLMLEILERKERSRDKKDFLVLAELIERFRELNYSKKRKYHNIH